jgi:spermidine synthase
VPNDNVAASRPLGIALHASAFFSGFVTMALEMLIGRTLIPYLGGTIYTWGALISVFLIGMTIGYVIGGKAADRWPDARVIAVLFFLAALAAIVVPFYGEQTIDAIMLRVEDLRYAALLSSIALACLPAALLAAAAPYCLRLLLDQRDHSGTVSGRLSALCTAGSILGTLGTSFYFIPNFGVRSIYYVLAATSIAVAVVVWVLAVGNRARLARPQSAAPIAVALLVAMLASVLPGRALAGDPPLPACTSCEIERVDSEYNTIFVNRDGDEISLNFGHGRMRYTESVIDIKHRDELVVNYTRYMTSALAFNPNPVRKIALVGLGGGRTITYLVNGLPGAVAEVAEIDPAVMRLANKYFGVTSTPRLHIHNKDGRIFLRQSPQKYDLILLDAYRGPFVPFHLTTKEFYQLTKQRLNPGGVVAQNVEPTTMFFDSAYATMKSVFDLVDVIDAGGNIVLVGYAGKRVTDAQLMTLAGMAQDRYKLKYDLRMLVKARQASPAVAGARILTDDFAPVEMLKTIKRHNEKRP